MMSVVLLGKSHIKNNSLFIWKTFRHDGTLSKLLVPRWLIWALVIADAVTSPFEITVAKISLKLVNLRSVFSQSICFGGQALTEYKNLKVLYFHANVIEDIRQVDKLATLPQLRTLTMHGNLIEEGKGYRWD